MISDTQIIAKYYGQPPYYRNLRNGYVEKLPFRVRLPDGTTRTDPDQWKNDPEILFLAGYMETSLSEEDIARFRPTLQQIQNQKLSELENYWSKKIQDGWTTPSGWKLGLKTEDVTLLTGAFLLLKESVNLGLSNSVNVVDTDNQSHTMDLTSMTQLMLGYGSYRANLSDNYSNLKNQINNASSIEQVEAIVIGD